MEQLVVDRDGVQPELNAHGTDEQLELYALGRLPKSEHAQLEEHLLVCAACREKLDGISDFALGMRAARKQTLAGNGLAARLTKFLRRPAVSMALALALVLVVVGIFSTGRKPLAPSTALRLRATRGEMPQTIPARSYNLLLVDGPREGGPFRIEVLSAGGRTAWSGLAVSGSSGVEVDVTQSLPEGDYFVRVYSAAGKVLREYGFRVRN